MTSAKWKFKNWIFYLLIIILVSLHSCKSIDRIFVGAAADDLNADQLVDLVIDNQLNYNQLFYRRALIEIDQNGNSQAVRANIYLKKDSAIIISVMPIMGIELYRIKLDKEGVIFIDRMNRTITETNYSAISKRVLVDFSYDQIQSILSNRVFTYPDNDMRLLRRFSGIKNETHYSLSSSGVSRYTNRDSFQIVDILPGLFRVHNTHISFPSRHISMNVAYSDFVSLSGNIPFPSKIILQGVKGQESIVLSLSFNSVDIDGDQSISFTMPTNYEKIKL